MTTLSVLGPFAVSPSQMAGVVLAVRTQHQLRRTGTSDRIWRAGLQIGCVRGRTAYTVPRTIGGRAFKIHGPDSRLGSMGCGGAHSEAC